MQQWYYKKIVFCGLKLSQKRNVPFRVLKDLVISCCVGGGSAMSRSPFFIKIEKWGYISSRGVVATIPFSTDLLKKFFFFFVSERNIFVRVTRWTPTLEKRKIQTWRVNRDEAASVKDLLISFISASHKDSCNSRVPVQSRGFAQKDSW